MDVHNKHIRSYNMSQIKGKNTKPRMLVQLNLLVKSGSTFSILKPNKT